MPGWGKLLVLLVLFVVLPALGHLELRMANIGSTIDGLPEKIGSQVDAKLEKLRGDLIDKFFSEARKFRQQGNYSDAADEITAATFLVRSSATDRVPASPQFFDDSIQTIK